MPADRVKRPGRALKSGQPNASSVEFFTETLLAKVDQLAALADQFPAGELRQQLVDQIATLNKAITPWPEDPVGFHAKGLPVELSRHNNCGYLPVPTRPIC
jgi:hypothetical protein